MQPLLDGPRADLSESAIREVLQGQSGLKVGFGAVALDSDFRQVDDISEFLSDGQVNSDVTATVNRSVALTLDSDVTSTGWSYLSGYVQPYMTLTNLATGFEARFNLGVYTLTTPENALDMDPAALAFQGYDLIYLLDQPIGDSYEIPFGSDPAQAAADAIALAIPGVTVDVTPSGNTTTAQVTFPLDPSQPTTYLHVVNLMLSSIGYRQVWVDWEGVFQIEPFIDVQQSTPEWTFDLTDNDNIVAEARTQTQDLFNVPNWWRFVVANLSDVPIEGETMLTYEDNSATNPGSTVNRGRYVRKVVQVTVTSYNDLVDFAQRTIDADLKPSETFSVTTQPFPLAWHLDVIEYRDPNLGLVLPAAAGASRKVIATQWTLPLSGQADMTWTWQTVTDQSVLLGLSLLTS